MCGIVGYIGRDLCKNFVLEGLKRLEYRGYDSAGFACIDTKLQQLSVVKEVGKIVSLEKALEDISSDGLSGIGHTRWATHGIANQKNAHPHLNCQKNIAVVHNGIIEGSEALRKTLQANGHEFSSQTDTELLAHLLSDALDRFNTPEDAIKTVVQQLQGAFAAVFLLEAYPETLFVMRRRSPLVIGVGKDASYVASDHMVFVDKTQDVLFMPEESFGVVSSDSIKLYDFEGNELGIKPQKISFTLSEITKKGYESFMLKEMYEQKRAIDTTISFYEIFAKKDLWHQLGLSSDFIQNLKTLHFAAAGTSWHAARISQFFFEIIANIPTRVHLASEFRYMPFFPEEESLSLFVTQSGETADTLEALRLVRGWQLKTLALTNVPSSSIVREADGALLMQAGPEISVCSTKAFSTQLASLYWFAHRLAYERGCITEKEMEKCKDDLFVAAEVLEATMETYKHVITTKLAKFYAQFDRFIFLGRHTSYPFAMEAALKLKEISYIFAQCYPAGELKHGPIALIDEKTPVVIFSVLDPLIYQKLVSNAQEVKARKGHIVVFAFEDQNELIDLADTAFIIPRVAPLLGSLAMTGVMQLFVYAITKELGCPIDKPRNLAKSVTVE